MNRDGVGGLNGPDVPDSALGACGRKDATFLTSQSQSPPHLDANARGSRETTVYPLRANRPKWLAATRKPAWCQGF
jgi:hypothetical protein